MLDEIRKLLGKDWTDTLDLIRATLKSDIRLLDATNESILSSGGKRVRPMLSLLVARACGSFAGKALPRTASVLPPRRSYFTMRHSFMMMSLTAVPREGESRP